MIQEIRLVDQDIPDIVFHQNKRVRIIFDCVPLEIEYKNDIKPMYSGRELIDVVRSSYEFLYKN